MKNTQAASLTSISCFLSLVFSRHRAKDSSFSAYIGISYRSARLVTVSRKLVLLRVIKKAIASPLSPQPKQKNTPFGALTVKLGDFSLWKGQSPVCSWFFCLRLTYSPMISTISIFSLRRSRLIFGILDSTNSLIKKCLSGYPFLAQAGRGGNENQSIRLRR